MRPFFALLASATAATAAFAAPSPSAAHQALAARDDQPGPSEGSAPSMPSINSNNTADCTNCTNLGNFVDPLPVYPSDPRVTVRNGTYAGIRLEPFSGENTTFSGFGVEHAQDLFLGMPYALQPTGERRFKRAIPLNESWSGEHSAKRYSEFCFSIGTDNDYNPPFVTYKLGEQCLTLNVVRPANTQKDAKLPVWVWQHGGGFAYGGSGDKRYNGSFIVDAAQSSGQPLIFVSINYRTGILGFPTGDEASEANVTNLGLYDSRLALHWIRETIASFGGDPEKITITGESAGGASMFFQLSAYGGRDDKLFRSVIAESGYWATPVASANTTAIENAGWASLLNLTGCAAGDAAQHLSCLRSVPLESIKQAQLNITTYRFQPVVDGDMVQKDLQRSYLDGDFVKGVDLLITANNDEGTAFVPAINFNTSDQIIQSLRDGANLGNSLPLPDGTFNSAAQAALLDAYPDDEGRWPPYSAGPGLLPGGMMKRRAAAIYGDLVMVGPKRSVAQAVSRASGGSKVYNGRFDQLAYGLPVTVGATHFQEVSFVFHNPLLTQNPLGPNPRDIALSKEMNAYWRSFVVARDPNAHKLDAAPHWPAYCDSNGNSKRNDNGNGNGEPQLLALRRFPVMESGGITVLNSTAFPDEDRAKGIQLLMDIRAGSYKAKRDEL